jgi:hypothetical protein
MTPRKRSKFKHFLGETIEVFNKNKTSWVGLVILIVMVVIAILAPLLAPYNPVEQHILQRLQPSSQTNLLGTDHFGRDILSRIIYGARISLTVGVFSILLGLVIGGAFGLVAGYKGGWVDNTIMRVMDVFMSFPTLIMGLLIVAVLGASLTNLIVAIALTVALRFARIARAPTVTVKEVVRYFCQRVAVMYLGRIVEQGSVDEIFDDPLHPYTHVLREASLLIHRMRLDRALNPLWSCRKNLELEGIDITELYRTGQWSRQWLTKFLPAAQFPTSPFFFPNNSLRWVK